MDDFTKAISFAPGNAEPFEGRGLSYLATGDYKSALEDFNEAIKRDGDSYEAWTNQGLALEKLGEKRKAYAAFAHAANLNPNYRPAKEGMRPHDGHELGARRRRRPALPSNLHPSVTAPRDAPVLLRCPSRATKEAFRCAHYS
ncbi:MAG: tetratricopeptide repeat protein [Hyphomicrobium sp.]